MEEDGLELVGFVASESSTIDCKLILLDEKEREVKAEDIVLIENDNGNKLLAVCREGVGSDENLRVGGYTPGIAYVRSKGSAPSSARRSYHFILSIIGEITNNGIEQNYTVIAPGSKVYIYKGKSNPLELLAIGNDQIAFKAHYREKESWLIPFNTKFINYHIGVFGTTGCGKSSLTREVIIPIIQKVGYGILILDWNGMDYSPFFKKETMLAHEFEPNPELLSSFIISKMRISSSALQGYIEEFFIDLQEDEEELKSIEVNKFIENLENYVKKSIKESSRQYAKTHERQWKLGKSRLNLETVSKLLSGDKKIGELVDEVSDLKRLKVIDLHELNTDQKLLFFTILGNELLDRISLGRQLKIALFIDEAPQYVPYRPEGMQKETTNIIMDLCAMGRKHGIAMVLISQAIAGEIGINASVRRNLNTQFIGQIHPLDKDEVASWLSPYDIPVERLLNMKPGYFYFLGKMNPSPTPLQISFKIGDKYG
jgi:hypothetical protein